MASSSRPYCIYASDEAWSSLPRPRGQYLSSWPLEPVRQFRFLQRKRRCLVLSDKMASHLEAIALLSKLRNPARTHSSGNGLIGFTVEAIGQLIYEGLL